MKVLILGSGGREHALAWKCAQDDAVKQVFVATGNAGTTLEPKCDNVALDVSSHADVIAFIKNNDIGLTIVGPEAPLVAGIVDDCRAAGCAIWGPTKACAMLEGSKDFAKTFMLEAGIPTAQYQSFTDAASAKAYISDKGAPIVVKADGLAAGKGVIVAETLEQAHAAVDDMLESNKFGDAGARVVIEDFLTGEEASFICLIDGTNILPMATSQDHKRIGEGDTGLNTGGMGAYSPAPVVTTDVKDKVIGRIIQPVVDTMKARGTPYTGFLYAGLMVDDAGDPYVIEFNCRFGDPETQPIMMRLQSSLVELIQAGLDGNLPKSAKWDDRAALGVVLASAGYPESSSKGDVISGLPKTSCSLDKDDVSDDGSVKVFHAGTQTTEDNHVVTSGGRVLCVTALGDTVSDAQQLALECAGAISFSGMQYRRDIGWRAIERNQ